MPIQQLPGTAVVPNSIGSSAISTTVSFGPKISAVAVTDSGYTVLDDTAVSVAGGYIKITGTGFVSGCTVVIGTQLATSVSFVSSTEIRAQIPAQAAGSYIVYLTNPDGGIAIRVNAVNYSATPTWTTTSPLADGLVDSAISIQFAASSNSTVVYALQAGSTLPPGLTLNSSGLLSGTVTNLAATTTYNFTVVATDLELQDTPRAFSVTINAADLNFKHVTALLSASTPASTFVSDASTNNFSLTVFGDARPSNFNPYTNGYYSNYFDGSGDYLTATYTTTALDWWASDYTIEAWIYPTTLSGLSYSGGGGDVHPTLIGNRAFNSATDYWSFGLNSANGSAVFYYFNGTPNNVSSTATANLNQWNHIAMTKTSSGIRLFVNGIGNSATAISGTPQSSSGTALTIGAGNNTYLNAYVSNIRVLTGTALYTSNFTPSATPLTAISNTSLLTCRSNRFIDTSTNNFTITRNGDVRVDNFDPFVPIASTTGSVYLDGNSDYIGRAYSADFNLGSTYTIEMWAYSTTASGWKSLYAMDFALTDFFGGMNIGLSGATGKLYFSMQINTGSGFQSSAVTIPAINNYVNGQWYHVAISVNAGTGTFYVNGQAQGSATVSEFTGTPVGFGIGAHYNGYNLSSEAWPGYIADFRIVKSTAVYTANFTPATSSLTAINNTLLLTAQNNQPTNNNMFLDSSTNAFNISRNGNATQGTFSPYGGGWSNYFDGSGDALTVAGNSALDLTGDFTIEFWANMQSDTNYLCNGTQVGSGCWRLNLQASTGTAIFDMAIGSWAGLNLASAAGSFTKNVWAHFAVTRSGNTFRLFINGAVAATTTNSGSLVNTGRDTQIGYYTESSGTYYSQWYLSNLRIVKGTAVYTTAFTPSVAPLTAIAGTSLLTCADNRFMDDSANNFAITRTGDVAVQRFNPFNPVVTTPTSYSGFFDGNGDFLTVPDNEAFNLAANNWTIEAWICPLALPSSNGIVNIASQYIVAGSRSFLFCIYNNAGTMQLLIQPVSGGTETPISQNCTFNIGEWIHVAAVRSNNNITLYRNGVSLGTTAYSSTINDATGPYLIGCRYNSSSAAELFFTGYISNHRLVNGTAVYTSNFTPSTTPLTAIANTSLLTCQSATFVDASTNAFTPTANGDAAPRQFNPFGWASTTTAYTPAVYGGSAYFDGTGDFLNAPTANNAFAYGSGNFTVEAWIYPTKYTATIIDNRPAGSATGLFLGLVAGGNVQVYSNVQILISPGTVPLNTWTHIALSRSSNTMYLYINGVMVTSASNSTNFTDNNLRIGEQGGGGQPFGGYITDVRITKGIACYTSNFQPPIVPLTALTNTTLFTNMTGAGIYDSSMMVNYETVGNAGISTSIKKYGNSSMSFDGTGDYVFVPSNATASLASDFTIELWAYRAASGNYRAFTIGDTVGASGIEIYVSGANWVVYSNSATRITGASATREVWTHLVLVRSGSTVTLYVNGTASGSTWSSSATFSGATYVGAEFFNASVTADTNGYIADFRITRGVARYTTTFTPPTSPLIQR